MAQCPPTKSDGQKNGEPLKLPATADFKNTIHNIESVLVLCTWTFDESEPCCLNHHKDGRFATSSLETTASTASAGHHAMQYSLWRDKVYVYQCLSRLLDSRGTEIHIQLSLKIDMYISYIYIKEGHASCTLASALQSKYLSKISTELKLHFKAE